jgi:flagellar biosynthesis GTPase FlhF
MGEAAEVLEFQPNEVKERALTIIEQANAIVITDNSAYNFAGVLWKNIKDLKDQVNNTFKPIIEKAHAAHKEALAQKAKIFDPLDAASRTVKSAMEKYDREQEAIRKAEEARLAEIARKEAEERALLDAIAAEEEAKRNGATQEQATAEAEAIIAEPVYVPPVVLPRATPKLQGGPVFQKRWDFEVVNASLIPRQYLTVDLVKIRQIVTALKDQTNIPGVKVFEKRV